MNADGSGQTNLTNHPGADLETAFSPDGSKIAFASSRGGNFDVYVMNADGSGPTRLTDDPMIDVDPAFSLDGSKIAFRSNRAGNDDVYVMNADGSGQTNLTNHPATDSVPDWGPATDSVAPQISISSPQGSYNVLLAILFPPRAQFTCTDNIGGTGVASCTATIDGQPVANGEPVRTGLGTHTFTVTAIDHAGNISTQTTTYTVTLL
jgi:TolB protein